MSQKFWIEQLRQIIQTSNRIVIVGVGNPLRGDDSVGVQIIQSLRETMPPLENVLLCEAGPAPENYTGVLRRFAPEVVLLIDAVQMDAPPGTVCLLDAHLAASYPSSTHTLPLSLFVQYLENELNCKIALLGIQPVDLSLDASLSPTVRASKANVTRTIKALLLLQSVPTIQDP